MAGVRQFDEASVLTNALAVFWQKGFQATSMIDLAKTTGVQRGSLYNAYGNKSTLFSKAFDYYANKLIKEAEASLSDPDPKTALNQLFGFFTSRLCDDPDGRGCLSTKVIMEAKDCDESIQNQLKMLLDQLERVIAQRLQQAHCEGQFHGDCEATARYLIALTRGIAVIERIYRDQNRIKEIYCTAISMLPFYET